MFIKPEAGDPLQVILTCQDEGFVQAVHERAVMPYIQLAGKDLTDQASFPAGNSEIPGSLPGWGGLVYFSWHTPHEMGTISAVSDDVIELTCEFE